MINILYHKDHDMSLSFCQLLNTDHACIKMDSNYSLDSFLNATGKKQEKH